MTHATRPVTIADLRAEVRHLPGGSYIVSSLLPLEHYPHTFTDHVRHWASVAPDRAMIAERGPDGAWQHTTYAQAWAKMQPVAQSLLNRNLSADRPVMILSGNSIAHLLLTLGAMLAGVPTAPVSTAYSTAGSSLEKLRAIIQLVTPGLVFADRGERFKAALQAASANAECVTMDGLPGTTPFASLLATGPTGDVAEAAAHVGPESVAKIMFTSGSTGAPKAVATTHRMVCSNQQMLKQAWPFMAEAPPVMLDWLPWSHTFGGSHNVGMAITNGGTFYIDGGRPVAGAFEITLKNLREIAPTVYLNVPKAYEDLLPWLEQDEALRENFFSRLKMLFYSGASLQPQIWDALDRLAVKTTGQRVQWMTSLGCTESAPAATACPPEKVGAGMIGLPLPGVEFKMVPSGEKLEVRFRGPNLMPGYWRNQAATAAAFDEDGFYITGDALAPLVRDDPTSGFRFDGRVLEDFKLSSGTWVFVGALRLRLLVALAPYVRDVVIAAGDRPYIALLAIPAEPSFADDPEIREKLAQALADFGKDAGSAARPLRLVFLTRTLSVDSGELTDKGSVSQRTVLRLHADLVDSAYREPPGEDVICIRDRLS